MPIVYQGRDTSQRRAGDVPSVREKIRGPAERVSAKVRQAVSQVGLLKSKTD